MQFQEKNPIQSNIYINKLQRILIFYQDQGIPTHASKRKPVLPTVT